MVSILQLGKSFFLHMVLLFYLFDVDTFVDYQLYLANTFILFFERKTLENYARSNKQHPQLSSDLTKKSYE